MSALRKLNVDLDKCIGCQACTHACPAGLINFSDHESLRTLKFAASCAEDCTRCADVCSEKAIALLAPAEGNAGVFSAEFPLRRCAACDTPYATEQMVTKLRTSLPALLVPTGLDWINRCLPCRRTTEAAGVARQGLLSRRRAAAR
ncbi:MAG: 4Fe-4S binding protein [Desulfobacterales bacterium]|nr:MAG: 4Fe-4S binding protein [Desulfobacterales bacterium]